MSGPKRYIAGPAEAERIMRWLRANGVEHRAEEILAYPRRVYGPAIEYETIILNPGHEPGRMRHHIPERVTFGEANPSPEQSPDSTYQT